MSNTTDSYVPLLARHEYTSGGCSNGSHEQPSFNLSNAEAFTETWEGYIKVDADIENCVLKVSADDNACFFLYAFPDHKAELLPRGPQGGGGYTDATSTPIPQLKKGYYRAKVTYENINYPGANAARLEVQLGGSPITIGQLETHNLLTGEQAIRLRDLYGSVKYGSGGMLSHDVWEHVGGDFLAAHEAEIAQYTTDGIYDVHEHSLNGDWYNTCALRVSVALSQYGADLSSYSIPNMFGKTDVLPPGGEAIVSAPTMTTFLGEFCNCAADFSLKSNYDFLRPTQEDNSPQDGNPNPDGVCRLTCDLLCFGGRMVDNGANHVGICPVNDPDSGLEITEKIWILYRPSWGDPVNTPHN